MFRLRAIAPSGCGGAVPLRPFAERRWFRCHSIVFVSIILLEASPFVLDDADDDDDGPHRHQAFGAKVALAQSGQPSGATPTASIPRAGIAVTDPGFRNSLVLNGLSAFAEAPHHPELNLTADWTVEAWFKDEDPNGFNHDNRTILSKGDPNGDPRLVP